MAHAKHLLKHRLKRGLRRVLGVANGLGLGLLLRRLGQARGGAIVMTHCVGHEPATAYLPADMKTSERKVERLLRALRRRGVRCVTVRELVLAFERGDPATDLLAFTMDDGYADNYTRAFPLLERYGASGTVYVETHVVDAREVSWMHRYFWVVARRGEEFFAAAYARLTGDDGVRAKVLAAAGGASDRGARYDLKRVLKYEADPDDRDRVSRRILAEAGGTDADIAPAYLTWEQIAEMDRGGIEFGAHTLHHAILSRLDRDGIRREIGGSTAALRRHVSGPVETFAYPFGRRWDYGDDCFEVLQEHGYRAACAALDGLNDPATDRMQLRRIPLNDEIPLADVLAEIDGTLPLARRLLRIQL